MSTVCIGPLRRNTKYRRSEMIIVGRIMVGNELLASQSDYTAIYGVGYHKGHTMDEAFGMIDTTTP